MMYVTRSSALRLYAFCSLERLALGKLIPDADVDQEELSWLRCMASCMSCHNISIGRCKENCSGSEQQLSVDFSSENDSSNETLSTKNANECCETMQLFVPSPSSSPDSVKLKWQCINRNVSCDAAVIFIIQQKVNKDELTEEWKTIPDLIIVNSTQQVLRRLEGCFYSMRVVAVSQDGIQGISNNVNLTAYPVPVNASVVLFDNRTNLDANVSLTPHVGWENTFSYWNLKIDHDQIYNSTDPQAPILPKTFTKERNQRTVWLGKTDHLIGQSFVFTFEAVTKCLPTETLVKMVTVEYGKFGLTPTKKVTDNDLSLRPNEIEIVEQYPSERSTISVVIQWIAWTKREIYNAEEVTAYHIHWGNMSTSFFPIITAGNVQVQPDQFNITLPELLPKTWYGIQVIARRGKTDKLDYEMYNFKKILTMDTPVPSIMEEVTQTYLSLPPTLAMPSSSSSTSSNIIQIVIPVCFLVALLVVVVAVCCRCFIRYRTGHKSLLPGEEMVLNLYETYALRQSTHQQQSPTAPDRWEIPSSCIQFQDVLGEGAFGQVTKAVVEGCWLRNSHLTGSFISTKGVNNEPVVVAVKVLHGFADSGDRQNFLREIDLMKALGHHPNVVSLLACCTLEQPICLVVEHCEHGDLLNYIRIHRNREMQTEDTTNTLSPLTPKDLLSFARQIALGMEYLSQKGFVHRDLAARNVLVADNKIAKIGDFGLTRYVYNDKIYLNRKGGKLPIKWMSIEAIFDHVFTSKSDIWSYGVLLSEIATMGCSPYPAIHNRELLKLLQQGYRMERPENCSQELYSIMLSCWNDRPEDRPTFTDIRYHLEDMLEQGTTYLDISVDPYRDCFCHSTSTSSTDSTLGLEPVHNTEQTAFIKPIVPKEKELLESKLQCLSKESSDLSFSKNCSADSGVVVSDDCFNRFSLMNKTTNHLFV
ncbi:uncharacterized protein LOC117111633 isoform X3 [Anneissia japonica]|uniref:uncharacterized protein LOC117111633 isoform X3 n=1 Tax=Anneissia japonica TaxID=1529436 RepID=UPI001425612B|nr:uncharacterized protein LOC117111633 isoform X3 [Anneissia japonica]